MIESDFFKELEKALKLNDFSTSYNTVIPKIFGSSLAELENNVFHVSYSFVEEDVNFTGFLKNFASSYNAHNKMDYLSCLFYSLPLRLLE